jgi:hypothetical protein
MEKLVLLSFFGRSKKFFFAKDCLIFPILIHIQLWHRLTILGSADGSVASSMDKRKGSTCQQDAHGDSHELKRMMLSVPTLPEVL